MIIVFTISMLFQLSIEVESNKYDNYFNYTDLRGSESCTEQFDGCIVFISFWSRSCAPCIRGFSQHRELRQQLIDEGVVIINATIDNMDEWFAACNRYNPNGLNVRPINKELQTVQRHYDVYSLPVYATLDIDGQLVQYEKTQRGNILDFEKWFRSKDR